MENNSIPAPARWKLDEDSNFEETVRSDFDDLNVSESGHWAPRFWMMDDGQEARSKKARSDKKTEN